MSLQDMVIMIRDGEYGRAVSSLELDVKDGTLTSERKLERFGWLAECNAMLEEHGEAGNWYVEGVRAILSQRMDNRSKAKHALPLCAKALEAHEKGGDPADVLVTARLKQYLVGLSK